MPKGQRQAPGEIEDQLRTADPRLSALFTNWTGIPARGRRLPRLSVRGGRHRRAELARILFVAVGLALAIGLAVAGILSASAARPPRHSPYPATDMVPASAHPGGPHR